MFLMSVQIHRRRVAISGDTAPNMPKSTLVRRIWTEIEKIELL